ncbi:hypothetical protein [Pelagicoccus albus]|uniref:Glycosyltransferase RgtA/B/C/D-like domain-containing protein n=1 Tax=Pelagicoccus albus TaxID=415222 RepID=A0A7X1B7T2_9BACT|nr:hypothetical protein [Pelagicoccus albus]MBC2607227.1 hypothetical protein [Pelagicoccus albus]
MSYFKYAPPLIIIAITAFVILPINNLSPTKSLPSLGLTILTIGDIQQVADSNLNEVLNFDRTSYPNSIPRHQKLSLVLVAGMYTKITGVSPATAYVTIISSFALLSYIIIYKTLFAITASSTISILLPLSYFFSPYISTHSGHPPVLFSFFLLPTVFCIIFRSYYYFQRSQTPKSIFLNVLVTSISFIFLAFTDPYALVFSILFFSLLSIRSFLHLTSTGTTIEKLTKFLIFTATPLGITYSLYKMSMGEDKTFITMPFDFFRAQGMDLLTFFLPQKGLLLPELFGYTMNKIDKLEFYGDGSNIRGNYLNPIFIISAVMIFCLALISTKRYLKNTSMVFLVFFAMTLLLSLGPSLKINSHKERTATKDKISFNDYLMPSEDAILDLPHGNIYKFPVIKDMRAVYRWTIATKIAALFIFAYLYRFLFRSKTLRRYAFLIVTIIIAIESLPTDYTNKISLGHKFMRSYDALYEDLIPPLANILTPEDIVFFPTVGNPYLINYISPMVGFRTYNIAGDKAIPIARKNWPDSVRTIEKPEALSNDNLLEAFNSSDLTAVVMTKFDPRWNSYSWPPKTADHFDCSRLDHNVFDVIELDYYSVIKKK